MHYALTFTVGLSHNGSSCYHYGYYYAIMQCLIFKSQDWGLTERIPNFYFQWWKSEGAWNLKIPSRAMTWKWKHMQKIKDDSRSITFLNLTRHMFCLSPTFYAFSWDFHQGVRKWEIWIELSRLFDFVPNAHEPTCPQSNIWQMLEIEIVTIA